MYQNILALVTRAELRRKTNYMKIIRSVVVERILDENPYLDYLGKFSDEKGKFGVPHRVNHDHAYSYFNADNVENMKQARQNYDQMMKYENGELCDYGVKATAEILTSFNDNAKYADGKILAGNWLINKIQSGGLWGLSSDGSNADFDNEAENQLSELHDNLKEFGFSEQEISEAPVDYKNWY